MLVRKILFALFFLLLITSCATTPDRNVWRPWIDVYGSTAEIDTDEPVSVSVNYVGPFEFPDHTLVETSLKSGFSSLLERRGFAIVKESTNAVIVDIKVSRFEGTETNVSTSYRSMRSQYSTGGLGVGVTTAGMVASLSQSRFAATSAATSVNQNTQLQYMYDIRVRFVINDSTTVWDTYSTWDTESLNIRERVEYAVRLIFSGLPIDDDHTPVVPFTKTSHVDNYFNVRIAGRELNCPALPNPIRMWNTIDSQGNYSAGNDFDSRVSSRIYSPVEAMPLFHDLVTSAEYALPTGDSMTDDPLDVGTWRTVQLGGKYRRSSDGPIVFVIIDLVGSNEAYTVKSARVVSQEEYVQFEQRLSDWRTELNRYFSFYE